MKNFLTSTIGRLRLLAFLEGISLVILVFISAPLKHFYGVSTLSLFMGPLHGVLFLLFVINTISVGVDQKWSFSSTTWKVLVACLIPFGTFYIDHKILKPIHKRRY